VNGGIVGKTFAVFVEVFMYPGHNSDATFKLLSITI
jgi:hypothetical protein